jgi:hypothetical protein
LSSERGFWKRQRPYWAGRCLAVPQTTVFGKLVSDGFEVQ